jgi:hypothetical protein
VDGPWTQFTEPSVVICTPAPSFSQAALVPQPCRLVRCKPSQVPFDRWFTLVDFMQSVYSMLHRLRVGRRLELHMYVLSS